MPLLLLLGMAALLGDSAYRRSPVIDEPLHLTRGLAWWWSGDTRLSYAHPPFANLWCALPGALLMDRQDFTAWPGWEQGDVGELTQRLAQVTGEEARRALLWGRLMTALFLLLTAVHAFLRVRQWFGWWAATLTLALLTAQATWLAHGRLVTTDAVSACLLYLLLFEGAVFLRHRGPWPLVRLGLITGLAAASKYTATLIPFVLLLVGIAFVISGRGRYAAPSLGRGVARLGLDLVLVTAIALVILGATYRFQGTFLTVRETFRRPEPQNWVTAPYRQELLERTPLRHLPPGMRLPLPYSYVFGMASIRAHNARGHHTLFFGASKSQGHPAYFPLLLFMKTPLVIWGFLLLGLVAFLRAPSTPSALTSIAVLGVVVTLVVLATSRVNIGVRYALQVVPLLTVLAARGFVLAVERAGRRGRRALLGVGGAGLLAASLSLARSYPDLLGYFNEAVGRARGHRVSLVGEDWGQDAIDLARYARSARLSPLYYAPYSVWDGGAELRRLGVSHRHLRCGFRPPPGSWAAVHAVTLVRSPGCYPWTKRARRVRVIHDHIYLYRVGSGGGAGR